MDKKIERAVQGIHREKMPELWKWNQSNPDTLKMTIARMKENEPQIPIGSLMANLESDLYHS